MENTALGFDENIEGALAYLLGFITGILLIVIDEDNKFVKFHAIQSTLVFVILVVVNIFLGAFSTIPYIGWMLSALYAIVVFIEFFLWLFLIYTAYNHQKFKIPLIGDIAEKNST